MGQRKDSTEHNLYWEAIINQYNVIGLVGMAALSAVMGTPVPFLIAIGFELFYIALVPETAFFQNYVRNKYSDLDRMDELAKLRARLEMLHPIQKRRFEEISGLVDSTQMNLRHNETMGLEVMSKLNTLRDRYLGLMELLNAYENYLSSIRPNQILDALSDVEQQLATHESERVKQTLNERKDVLKKRQARLERVRENHAIVRTQVMTIEDIMRLIHESSMTMQNPQDIGRQIDDLLIDVEATEDAVQDLDSFGNASAQDELAAFDRELEEALHKVDHHAHVSH